MPRSTTVSFRSLFFSITTSLLLVHPSFAYNKTINRNYFNFPSLTDWIPVFAVGDTLNVSWSSEYQSRNINVWCGKQFYLIQTFSNLASSGYQLIQVLDTWLDPCHLEFYALDSQGNITNDFNSGAFNVNSVKAATATTWAADDLNSACATSYTGGTATALATNTIAIVSSQASASGVRGTDSTACAASSGGQITSSKSSSPSFGAGIGVGIAIALGIAAATAIGWWLLRKRKNKNHATELDGSQVNQGRDTDEPKRGEGYYGPPSELHNEPRQELPT